MVDVSAIAGAVSAIKGAADITKAMIGLRDAALMQSKVIELQSAILDAQAAVFAANDERRELVQKIEVLETEIKRFKSLSGSGERCPRCGKNEIRVERSEPHPHLGDLGARNHYMKCAACGFDDVQVTPA